jgi:hypothetical protein
MPQNIRFTTRRLFLISAGVALALATLPGNGDSPWRDWPAALLSMISFLAVCGLVQQLRDIWQLRRGQPLRPEELFAIRLAVSWRAVLATALVACYTLELFISRGILAAEWRGTEERLFDYGSLFPDLAWSLLVFLTLAATPGALPPRRGQFLLPRTRRAAAWLLACALSAVVLLDKSRLYYLVHVATAGIEADQPIHLQRRGTFPDHAREGFRFFWISCLATASVAVNVLALVGVARAVRTGSRWQRPALLMLLAGLGATSGYAIWYTFNELPRVSPDMAAVNLRLNGAGAAFIACAVVTASFIIALRLTGNVDTEGNDARHWRRPNGYLHESRATSLLALGLAAFELASIHDPILGFIARYFVDALRELVQYGSAAGLVRTAGWALHWPPTYLWLAIGWLALRLLFRHKNDAEGAPTLVTVPPARFLKYFLLAAWLVASGLLTLAAFAFAFWFGPWYR